MAFTFIEMVIIIRINEKLVKRVSKWMEKS